MPSNAFTTGLLALLVAGGQLAAAHMEMQFPAPLRSKYNPNAVNIDYSMTAPLSGDGSNYPCKGYLSDIGSAAGKSTATFAPGGTYNFTIVGGAAHGGGSCQASLSYDGGKTFTVVQSIVGGCPLSSSYPFSIPSDAKTGDAIFAWTWNNNLGNREIYMNCAAVTIGGGSSKREPLAERAVAFSSRPSIFLANVGNGCKTVDSADVIYPNPGPDVVTNKGATQSPPTGTCGSAAAAGSGSDSGSGSSSGSGSGSGSGAGSSSSAGAGAGASTSTSSAPAFAAPSPTTTAVPTVSPTLPGYTTPVAAVPTTLQTATKASSAAAPLGTGTGTGTSTGSGSSAAGTYSPGTACTNEGAWNCIAGNAFQRCASGSWSAVISMAAGTKCTAGVSDTFAISRRGLGRAPRRKINLYD
ncbi:hypothetical protein B0T26DRAFT_655767 [Lasiosphaeria miniovina]|uniref:Extracellular protein n=1 Tax=Lasiosphaeria miniovina TaxID=1954250 RepID=A0AA40DM59_9PEZI|nr:uncharacterized protein B0T26DRAFT_655767 [Lasiosphaeria miniovina]KAK0706341.1 hypothetical protein B0T26DRAFT_655767 [Lasiosphaeria miniovina]